MSARQRAERLVKLYDVRAQIDEEIHCIEAAMVNETEYIKAARASSRTKASIAACGTDSGYYRHLRKLKQPACPACLAAHALVTRERANRQAGVRSEPLYAVELETQSGPESAVTDRGLATVSLLPKGA